MSLLPSGKPRAADSRNRAAPPTPEIVSQTYLWKIFVLNAGGRGEI
jgi:hypothetical protein